MIGSVPNLGLSVRARTRLGVLTILARLSLFWELFWPRLVPLLLVSAGFLTLALLDLLPMLPFWLHLVILGGFAIAVASTIRYLLKGRYGVTLDSACHRIECDSGVKHRPLTALEDRPLLLKSNSAEEVLWQAHQSRMAAMVPTLRINAPSPGMPRRDPRGLRAVIFLLLLVAVAVGATDARNRVERALIPKKITVRSDALALDIWITPPDYTQMSPILLRRKENKAGKVVTVPVGSSALAQIGPVDGEPYLIVGSRTVQFKPLDESNAVDGWRAEFEIGDNELNAKTLALRLGDGEGHKWLINVVDDQKPEVNFVAPPKNKGRGSLSLQYEAKDDYGLSGLRMEVGHSQGWLLSNGRNYSTFRLPVPERNEAFGRGSFSRDFSDHPWAGTPVEVSLVAIDGLGQENSTEKIAIVLPERIFNHPVARGLIEARKLLNRPDGNAMEEVVFNLKKIAKYPQHFYNDTVVFLALTIAQARLRHDSSSTVRDDVQQILWETALRLEDGNFAVAERNLREIQKNIDESLRDGTDYKKIEHLMDQLQLAMEHYMRALAEHLRQKGAALPENMMPPGFTDSQDFHHMLNRARELSQSGARAAARRMLSRLSKALNSLQNGMRSAKSGQRIQQEQRALKGLRNLSRRQQELLDHTFRHQQNGDERGQIQHSKKGQHKAQRHQNVTDRLGSDQEELRGDLGRLIQQIDGMLGSRPAGLGRAERAMEGASKALQKGDARGASREQSLALNELRSATGQLIEKLARQQQGPIIGLGRRRSESEGYGRDPFGRPLGERPYGEAGAVLKMPTERDMIRSRKILQELRRRSSEHSRPRLEREYLERLIKRF